MKLCILRLYGQSSILRRLFCLKIRSKISHFPDEFILILEAKNIPEDGPEIMQSDAL